MYCSVYVRARTCIYDIKGELNRLHYSLMIVVNITDKLSIKKKKRKKAYFEKKKNEMCISSPISTHHDTVKDLADQ